MAETCVSSRMCETTGCDKEAKLQCPSCLKLGIQGSYFCSQTCFKGFWAEHKKVHKKTKQDDTQDYLTEEQRQEWAGFRFTGNLRPGKVPIMRTVPDHIPRPDYALHPFGESACERQLRGNHNIKVLSREEQEGMRLTCRLGREVLDIAAKAVRVGVTTAEIDRIVYEACIDRQCYPSPLNYYCFPGSCCTSVNEVICHGIPDSRQLEDGDIVNVDISVYHKGFHGDLNETFYVGNVDEKYKQLVRNSWECLDLAIKEVKPGVRYRDIGAVIQKHAQSGGFSVVRSYCGHGIHSLFHTAPSIPHYAKNKAIGVMKPGHCFTIEPMINEGVCTDILWQVFGGTRCGQTSGPL
ncbi:methionine aminopeptidase 1-like isoform X2 [Dreissena polymorpha]|uniref:methionine aminopeptidase 1-like isoform X2 n=1 Tax=Dreissena polymorpha TaxID=45954 RepID=UPI002264BBFA|nr:methionine aminopeptidase 1-like isoform X2 [Dreissena polymorpha]